MYYVYIPLLVLVFLGSCRLLFGKGRICGCPTQSKHQADNLAKLRQEFLSVTELIAKIFGAVSRTTSLMRLSALLVNKRCRCRDDGFCSGCACVAHVRLCTFRYACSVSLTFAACSASDYLLQASFISSDAQTSTAKFLHNAECVYKCDRYGRI